MSEMEVRIDNLPMWKHDDSNPSTEGQVPFLWKDKAIGYVDNIRESEGIYLGDAHITLPEDESERNELLHRIQHARNFADFIEQENRLLQVLIDKMGDGYELEDVIKRQDEGFVSTTTIREMIGLDDEPKS